MLEYLVHHPIELFSAVAVLPFYFFALCLRECELLAFLGVLHVFDALSFAQNGFVHFLCPFFHFCILFLQVFQQFFLILEIRDKRLQRIQGFLYFLNFVVSVDFLVLKV